MQRDIKLGLVVGLFLLVLCGIFYIKMRSSGTKEEEGATTADTAMEKILHPEPPADTSSPLDQKLPPAVKKTTPPPDSPFAEKPATPPLTVIPPPAPEDERPPNAIGTITPATPTGHGDKETKTSPPKTTAVKPPTDISKPKVDEPRTPDFPRVKVEPPPAPVKPETPPNTAAAGGKEYVVQAGDTLSGIAAKTLGSSKHWKKILDANKDKLSGADKLVVDMKLKIPEAAVEEEKPTPVKEPAIVAPPAAKEEKKEPAANEGEVHVVQKGETLSDIAEQYLNDRNKWRQIAKANPDVEPNRLRVGQKIKIPKP